MMTAATSAAMVLAALAALQSAIAQSATAFDDALVSADYPELIAVLGDDTPIGAGVTVAQIEAKQGSTNDYLPDMDHADFDASSDPNGSPTVFTDMSNLSGADISGHGTSMGRRFYSNSATFSMAHGANNVLIYEANDWLTDVVKSNSSAAPSVVNAKVQNFSWIGSFDTTAPTTSESWYTPHPTNVKALGKFDYQIERDDYTAVVGVGNNTDPIPYLMSHSYNALVVGRSDGNHSTGLTAAHPQNDYGPGRSKPDIVVGIGTASAATATVSSAATVLRGVLAGTDADRSEPIKAILMAGATKDEFAAWSRTTTQPLDDTFGAGELNIFNSYKIQLGGQTNGASTQGAAADAGSYGWDYGSIGAGGELFYDFEVDAGSMASELSVILAWNVKIPNLSSIAPSLANLDLELFGPTGSVLDESISTVDNVEHVYLTDLGAGSYTLKVSGASASDFGLAWRMESASLLVSADFNGDSQVNGSDFLAWQRGYGTLINAQHSEGDADGDGDVDLTDLAAFEAGFGNPPITAAAFAEHLRLASVPEPTAAVLLLTALGALAWRRSYGNSRAQEKRERFQTV